jgi:PAS domain S-box-containing protein
LARPLRLIEPALSPVLVGLAYYLGAEVAFAIGTLTQMFAPFWPPNVILLCALLSVPERRWWIYVLAVFPAHVAAELGVAMPVPQLLMAFACNLAVAVLNAAALRRIASGPPWLSTRRNASWYLLIAAVVSPGVVAFAAGLEPTFGAGELSHYWSYWWRWYLSNALGSLTLAPVFLACFAERPDWLRGAPSRRWLEATALALGLALVCTIAFGTSPEVMPTLGFFPAALYAPVPFVLWAAVRFGRKGASGVILIVTVVSLWSAMQGHGPFAASAPHDSALALQLVLAAMAVPVILLAAMVEELRAAEANFRTLYNKAPAPQHSLDAEGKIIGVSDYWLQLLGYLREEVIGEPITAFMTPLAAERCLRSRPTFLSRGEESEEFEFVKRSGEVVEAVVSRRVERDMTGQVVRTLGVVTDMTARRKAERERDRIFEIAQDLIIISGFDGNLRDVNPAFEALLGYRRDELIGTPHIELVHPDDRSSVLARTKRLLAGEMLPFNEIQCRCHDGSWRWISWRPTMVREEGLVYAVGHDTTASRQTEEALRQAQKMEAVGLLTGGVAHDFNNLLTIIFGNLDLLEPKLASRPDLGPLVEAMQHAAKRGELLIAQLLAFSRRQTLHPETLDINELIGRFEPLVRRAVGESIAIETHLSPDLWPCTIDAVQLETALLNLATNARDAMPAGGRLTITTQNLERLPQPLGELAASHPHVVVVVRDTGMGMRPELIERVFEPFFTTKEAGKGTGLGLSQVYGFVKQSGGHVSIDSEVSRGTVVRLYLPTADIAATASARIGRTSSEAEPARGSERILIVEDDAALLETSTAMMSDLGYTVHTAAGSLEALEILRDANHPVDLLLSDVMMPRMSGVELAGEARKLRPGLKILLTSGYSPESLLPQGVCSGLPLIAKPYNQTTLAARLRALLDDRDPH